MAAVVQARCPGCKNTLHIPAEWVHQAIRCKICGLIMQARQPSGQTPAPRPAAKAPPPPRPATSPVPPARVLPPVARVVPPPSPPPVARVVPPPSRVPPARPAPAPAPRHAAPPGRPAPASVVPAPVPVPRHTSPPVGRPAPGAVPIHAPVAQVVVLPQAPPAPTWNFRDGKDEPTVRPRRRRRSFLKVVIFVFLLCGLGAGGVFAWPSINRDGRLQKAWDIVVHGQPPAAAPVDAPEKDKETVLASASLPTATATEPRKDTEPSKPRSAQTTPKATTPSVRDTVKAPDTTRDTGRTTTTTMTRPRETVKTDPIKPPPTPPTPPPPVLADVYPRRALVISVHNYLYANPISAGEQKPNGRNVSQFVHSLSPGKTSDGKQAPGLNIDPKQVQHLSDVASEPRPPLKQTIETALTNFLRAARDQDHLLVVFVGHSAEIDGQVYLAPIEGELDNAATLIPLADVLEQLAKCRAKEKVLVLDVNRVSPTKGTERPGSGPMSKKFEALIQAPPAGVRVWASCRAEQQSYETDTFVMGHFLDAIYTVLRPVEKQKDPSLAEGKIQRVADPLPLEQLERLVNGELKRHLESFKFTQQSLLTGSPPGENAVAFDPKEPLNPLPALPSPVMAPGNVKVVRAVLDEIGLPPVKASKEDNSLRYELLPAFPPARLADYEPAAGEPPAETAKLRQAVHRARILLWAASADDSTTLPPSIAKEVKAKQTEIGLKALPKLIREGYPKPSNEKQFKDQILSDEREVARILQPLTDAEQDLLDLKEEREKEGKRWQANYDFVLARVQAEIAYLYEYQSMLGQMRKDLAPPLEPNHRSWKLAAVTTLSGDSNGKRAAKNASKLYDAIIKDNPGTPWEVLAKREKLTALGLEWKPSSN